MGISLRKPCATFSKQCECESQCIWYVHEDFIKNNLTDKTNCHNVTMLVVKRHFKLINP